jgi:hypothetical protein
MPHTKSAKRLFDRFAVGAFGLVPLNLARHLLFLLRTNPQVTDRWGYHIRPIHYYDPLPDFSQIKPGHTTQRRVSPAIDFDFPAQLKLVQQLASSYAAEVESLAQQSEYGFDFNNDYFGGLDAALYYALLRHLKPKRVIEIGSGFSTQIASRALKRNQTEGHNGKLTCVEPYPAARLTEARLDIELIETPVEAIDLNLFKQLNSGDVLFIDSTHTVKFGSDVCREFLEILPNLREGVWIHVHDIFFPHEYPAKWVLQKRIAFNEQYLLEAFLAYNDAFRVAAAGYWLALEHPQEVSLLWPRSANRSEHNRVEAASLWLQKQS